MKEITTLETFEEAFEAAKNVIERMMGANHPEHWAKKWWDEYADATVCTGSIEDNIVDDDDDDDDFQDANPQEEPMVEHDAAMELYRSKIIDYNTACSLTVAELCDIIIAP